MDLDVLPAEGCPGQSTFLIKHPAGQKLSDLVLFFVAYLFVKIKAAGFGFLIKRNTEGQRDNLCLCGPVGLQGFLNF